MIDDKRRKEAKANFDRYLSDGLLKKGKNEIAQHQYLENADLSLNVANELINSRLKPYLWVIVTSYYSMFYSANAVLHKMGYQTQSKIAHKVTNDALIVLVLDKLKAELMEDFENIQQDALEIARTKAEQLIETYQIELDKRSRFQYNMLEKAMENKAKTSLQRATQFVFEMKKLLK